MFPALDLCLFHLYNFYFLYFHKQFTDQCLHIFIMNFNPFRFKKNTQIVFWKIICQSPSLKTQEWQRMRTQAYLLCTNEMDILPPCCDGLSTQHHHLEPTESGDMTQAPIQKDEQRKEGIQDKEQSFLLSRGILAKARNHKECKDHMTIWLYLSGR